MDLDPAAIRALRQQLGLTQQAFATKYQLGISTVRDWEQGRRHPHGLYRQLMEREVRRHLGTSPETRAELPA